MEIMCEPRKSSIYIATPYFIAWIEHRKFSDVSWMTAIHVWQCSWRYEVVVCSRTEARTRQPSNWWTRKSQTPLPKHEREQGMPRTSDEVIGMAQQDGVRFLNLQFTDILG